MRSVAAVSPMVSIVMPVYNGGDYFRLALNSALRQAYDLSLIHILNLKLHQFDPAMRGFVHPALACHTGSDDGGAVAQFRHRGPQDRASEHKTFDASDQTHFRNLLLANGFRTVAAPNKCRRRSRVKRYC